VTKRNLKRCFEVARGFLVGGSALLLASCSSENGKHGRTLAQIEILEEEKDIELAWAEEASEVPSGLGPGLAFQRHVDRLKALDKKGQLVWLRFTVYPNQAGAGEKYRMHTSRAYEDHVFKIESSSKKLDSDDKPAKEKEQKSKEEKEEQIRNEPSFFHMPAHEEDTYALLIPQEDNQEPGMAITWYTPLGIQTNDMQVGQKEWAKIEIRQPKASPDP